MADDKNARDEQAHNAERRQRQRELEEARERGDEPEPIPDDVDETVDDLDEALEQFDYPTTAAAVIEGLGDREIETAGGRLSLADALEGVGDERFDSADDVRRRIHRLIQR